MFDQDLGGGGTRARALAHLSDLHIGSGRRASERAAALSELLLALGIEHVVVTGDVTHRGQETELDEFQRIFAPWRELGALSVIPGNHDRLRDDVGHRIMPGGRVVIEESPGLHLVLVDSTGPHNRNWITGHGMITWDDIAEITWALECAPRGRMVALLLHHHLLPLPGEDVFERLFSWAGRPYAEALSLGQALLDTVRGRCDLVLHGHRHHPSTVRLFQDDRRPLSVCNAGSSTALAGARVFRHQGGRLVAQPAWMFLGGSLLGSELTRDDEQARRLGVCTPS
jgi:Icc protein